MPFDWSDYLTLAERLSASELEAARRTAISRAYYAAFHAASLKAGEQVPMPAGGFSHDQVWAWYAARPGRVYREIALLGYRLKRSRVQADYQDDLPEIERRVGFSLEDVRRLLRLLASIPKG